MRHARSVATVALMALALGTPASGAIPLNEAVDLVGEVRVREEVLRHVFGTSDPDGEQSFDYAHMRSRLGIAARLDAHTWLGVQFQDVRVLGAEGSTVAMLNSVDLKQAEMRFQNLLTEGDRMHLGRFEMKFGDQRLIGALDWADQGRSFDGLRLGLQPGNLGAEVFASRIRETGASKEDQTLVGGTLQGAQGAFSGELLAAHLVDDKPQPGGVGDGTSAFTTLSLRIAGQGTGWDATAEVAAQDGTLAGRSLSALAFAATGGVRVRVGEHKLRVGAEVDGATGDKTIGDDSVETFQTLLPTNHAHYGMADLMAWSNMTAVSVNAKLWPSDQVTVSVAGWLFRLWTSEGGWFAAPGAQVRSGASGASKDLGSEVDLLLSWTPSERVTVQTGWAVFLSGRFVEETGASPDPLFGYVQVRVGL